MKRDFAVWLAFIAGRTAMPHAWGRRNNDCAAFADGAVKALTGKGVLGRLAWNDERAARRTLKRQGGMEAALDARFERIATAHAHRGDIAGVPDDSFGIHPTIVEGATLCSPGSRGLKRQPRSDAVIAWNVTARKKKHV